MKRITALIFFVSFFIVFLPSRVLSYTDADFNEFFRQYLEASSLYYADLKQFELAKSQYRTFKSIAAEDEAVKAAKKMLLSKVNFIVKYLTSFRVKFAKETSILNYQENLLFVQLDNDIASYDNLTGLIEDARFLSDLDKIDLDIKDKYENSLKMVYKGLALIEFSRKNNFIEDLQKQLNELKIKLDEINVSDKYDFNSFSRRILSHEENIKKLSQNLNLEGKRYLDSVKGTAAEMNSRFLDYLNTNETIFKEIKIVFPDLKEIIDNLLKIA